MRNVILLIAFLAVSLNGLKCIMPRKIENGYSDKYRLASEGRVKISGGCIMYMETLIGLNPVNENVIVSVIGPNMHFPDSRYYGLDSFEVTVPAEIVSAMIYSMDSSLENPEKTVTFSTRALKIEISLNIEGKDMDTTLLEDFQNYNINIAYKILKEFLAKCAEYIER